MEAGRRRWITALGLFLAWVATLAALAVYSGHRPAERPGALMPR
jgi:hypothetical protein